MLRLNFPALFLIALMIVAHLVARPFDELTEAHRVLQWLELGSLCVCWLTLHAGTVFFVGEKEGRIVRNVLCGSYCPGRSRIRVPPPSPIQLLHST